MNTSSLLLSLAGLLLTLVPACRPDVKPPEPDPTTARAEAVPEEKPTVPPFVAIVTSRVNKVIVSEVEAKVETLPIGVGQRVHAGDTLATLDQSDLKAKLISARFNEKAAAGEVGAAAAQASAARAKLRSEQILARHGASPLSSVRDAAAQFSSLGAQTGGAAGRLAAARNESDMIATQIEKTTVKSPIDGVVTRIKLREGQLAQKGTPIAHVFDDRDLRIKFMVPAEYRSLLKKGMRISFQLDTDGKPAGTKVWAVINTISDELEPPANVTIAEADLDDSRLAPDQIRVASSGFVRLDDAAIH
jgi:multidrug efflux pump subunit AcrA (membrane-fusion protein)